MFYSILLIINHKSSCYNRLKPSNKPLLHGASCENCGLCFIYFNWHKVMTSLFINYVPLAVSRISGIPFFPIQCFHQVLCLLN